MPAERLIAGFHPAGFVHVIVDRRQRVAGFLNFLLLSGATHSGQMYHEAAALAGELDPAWSYRSKELMTLYAKAKAHEAGEKVEFGGKQLSPLYTPKNDTIISLFQITDEEQRKLRTLISSDMAKERDRERHTARRRAAGAVDRQTYESRSLSRQKPWEALGMSRASWYRAGKPAAPASETSPSVLQAQAADLASIAGSDEGGHDV
ncbi:hypothetical protein [Pseudomonas aeruginosa]|uniref:hypothetical protein n=1 Tax=Pseudomonas aeruginosa TaxID=287 RepID=UPI003F82094F